MEDFKLAQFLIVQKLVCLLSKDVSACSCLGCAGSLLVGRLQQAGCKRSEEAHLYCDFQGKRSTVDHY